jgi:uncharacterized protein YjdB
MRTESIFQAAPATRRTAPLALLLPFLALAACDGGEAPFTPPAGEAVASVEVTAPAGAMTIGTSTQLSATPRSRTGAPVSGIALTWSSSDTMVAAVSATGLVTAKAPGLALVRAAGGGRTGEAAVTVAAPQVASIDISPSGEIALEASTSTQLLAVARTAAGTPAAVAVAWSSSDERVARVTQTGTLQAIGAGTATVTAAAGGRTAQVTVKVRTRISFVIVRNDPGTSLQVGETRQLLVRGVTAAGDTLTSPAAWASENEGVATVDATGRVTAHRPGSALIRVTMEGVVGRASVVVAGTTLQQLESVGNRALPAQAGTRTFRDAQGVLHEQRVVVTGGTLRVGSGYEQRLALAVYEGDVLVGTEVYEDRGEIWYNAFTGHPILHSTVRRGLEVTTEAATDDGYFTGELDVFQDVAGDGQRVTLRFGKP